MFNWLKLALFPPIGAWLIRTLGVLIRIRYEGAEVVEKLHREGRHVIFAFWHNRQLMMPLAYRGSGVYALVSRHRDGELIARIVERFGARFVRGSSTRGGAAALRELIRVGRSGADLAVTPDGPKGPRYVAKLGVVQLAKATGLPIVPVAFSCSKKKSSQAGIASNSRFHSGAGCFGGDSPSGWRLMRPIPTWK
ncbi:MAG: lysophospholipid acyltransferase family protein [Nitrospirota bacterium]